jgi:hypothetical protein
MICLLKTPFGWGSSLSVAMTGGWHRVVRVGFRSLLLQWSMLCLLTIFLQALQIAQAIRLGLYAVASYAYRGVLHGHSTPSGWCWGPGVGAQVSQVAPVQVSQASQVSPFFVLAAGRGRAPHSTPAGVCVRSRSRCTVSCRRR